MQLPPVSAQLGPRESRSRSVRRHWIIAAIAVLFYVETIAFPRFSLPQEARAQATVEQEQANRAARAKAEREQLERKRKAEQKRLEHERRHGEAKH